MFTRSCSVVRFALGVLLLCVFWAAWPTQAAPVVALPDLVVNTVSAPGTVYAGQWISVFNSVSNTGDASTGSNFGIGFYLSQDSVYDGGDTFLGNRVSGALGVSGVSADNTSIQIPQGTTWGTYYIIVVADYTGVIPESNEANNTNYFYPLTIAKPDLRITSALSNAGNVAGGNFNVSATVNNNGGSRSQACTLRLYLSTDSQVDPDDTVLYNYGMPALDAQANGYPSFSAQLPMATAPGTYHLLLMVDATEVVDESNEGNNTRYVQQVTIGKPDLSASSLTGSQVVAPGQSYQYLNQFVNIGGSTSAETTASFYLSADAVFDEGDVLLGARNLPGLTPNSTAPATAASAQNTWLTIPASAPPGACYLLAVADVPDVVDESNESNNIRTLLLTVLNLEPVADAGGPYSGTEGVPILLDGSASYDPNAPAGSIESWEWDLDGDGQFDDASGETTEVTFPDNGEFEIGLRVTDDGSLTHEDTVTVTVTNVAPTVAPITMSDPAPTAGTQVQFSATFTDPGILDTHTALWTWGDGTTLAGAVTEDGGNGTVTGSHTYATAGTYTVTCTVTDKDGDVGTRTRQFTVQAGPCEFVSISGNDRYKTAVEASKKAYPTGAATVIIATGVNWPDALGGAALAGAVDGPLLLVKPTSLPDAVIAEMTRLGATDAYVLGGTAAVSQQVQDALDAKLTGKVTRIFGATRYSTANKVADEVIRLKGVGYSGDAFVATGANFPDALGASPLAASSARPILLAKPDGTPYLPAAVKRATILGGEAAVTPATESAVRTKLGSSNVTRVGGKDRYDTAAKIADHGVGLGMHWDGVGIATGMAFPDALSGGAMLGRAGSVLLLTKQGSLVEAARTRLTTHKADIHSVYFIGGTAAVSQGVRDEVAQLVE